MKTQGKAESGKRKAETTDSQANAEAPVKRHRYQGKTCGIADRHGLTKYLDIFSFWTTNSGGMTPRIMGSC